MRHKSPHKSIHSRVARTLYPRCAKRRTFNFTITRGHGFQQGQLFRAPIKSLPIGKIRSNRVIFNYRSRGVYPCCRQVMAFLFHPPRTNHTATLSHPSARRYCSRISFNYTQQFYGSQETSIMLQRVLGKHYSASLCKHQSCCRSSPLWNSALQTLLQGSTLRALIFSEKINLKIYPLPSYSSAVDTCDVVDARIADIIRTSIVRHGPTWLKHAAKEFHKPATLLLLCAFDRFCLMIF